MRPCAGLGEGWISRRLGRRRAPGVDFADGIAVRDGAGLGAGFFLVASFGFARSFARVFFGAAACGERFVLLAFVFAVRFLRAAMRMPLES